MKNSPLRLEKAFFTTVCVRANSDGNPDARWTVEAIPQVVKQGEEKRKWAISLKITLKPIGESKPAYGAEIEVAGIFSVDEAWPEAKIEQLVHANGCAVLYSAAREMVCNVTSRGAWPMLLLPTVSFVDTAPKPKAASTPTASAAP